MNTEYWKTYFLAFHFPPHGSIVRMLADLPCHHMSSIGMEWSLDFADQVRRMAVKWGAAPLFLVWLTGAVYWLKENREKWRVQSAPAIMIIASDFEKYPFFGRFLLFYQPVLLLCIAACLQKLYNPRYWAATVLLFLYGLLPMIFNTAFVTLQPARLWSRSDVRKVLEYILTYGIAADLTCVHPQFMRQVEFPQNPVSYFYHKSPYDATGLCNVDEHFNLDVEFIYGAAQAANVVRADEVWENFRMLKSSRMRDITEKGDYWANFFCFRDKYIQSLPLAVRYWYLARLRAG